MECKNFKGYATELASELSKILCKEIFANHIKKELMKHAYELQNYGVTFESKRSNGLRIIILKYDLKSDSSDGKKLMPEAVNFTDPAVTKTNSESSEKPLNTLFERDDKNQKDDTQDKAEYNGKIITISEDHTNLICTDKNGKTEELIRDPFPSSQNIQKIFVHGSNCYYLIEEGESSGICVRKIDLDTDNNTLVYDSSDENIEDFFGIAQKEDTVEDIFKQTEGTKWFFVTDDSIYWKKKYYITKANIKNEKTKIIADEVADEDVSFRNGILYYKGAKGETESYKKKQ